MSFIVSKVQKILSPLFKTPFGLCPALFFLYAKKTGVLNYFNLINFEPKQANILANDRLLSDLYIKSNFGKESPITYGIYHKIFAEFSNIKDNQFIAAYTDIIETVIDDIANTTGRAMFFEEFTQPKSLTNFIFALAKKLQPKRVFNPFAGSCSYAMLPNIEQFYGQEINNETFLLAQVRLDAHGIDINSVHLEDSANVNCFGDDMDCILCTPPFGLKIDFSRHTWRSYKSIYEFILYNFLDSPSLFTGIFVLPASVCFDKRYFDLRKTFAERGALDMVIELPSSVFHYTSISTVVLVVSKYRKSNKITFVDGKDCIKHISIGKNKGAFDLNTEELLSLVENNTSDKVITISNDELFRQNCSWHAGEYISYVDEIEEGQTLIPISEILELGSSIETSQSRGLILSPSDFFDDMNGVFSLVMPKTDTVTRGYNAYLGEHIVISMLQNKLRLCKCSFNEPFFVNQNQLVFAVRNDSPIKNIDYILYALLNSQAFAKLVNKFNQVNIRVTRQIARHILNCKIAVDLDYSIQHNLVAKCKAEYVSQWNSLMKAEQERLGIRTASADLAHMLGPTFQKVGTILDLLQSESLSIEGKESIDSLNDNFNYIKRFISAFGADFIGYTSSKSEIGINEFINSYLKSWKNFGTDTFSINYNSNVLDDTTFIIDKDMFRTLFDTLLDNAYRHGFHKLASPSYSVLISSSCVKLHDKDYVLIEVANNGVPFSEDFSLKKFITRGTYVGATGRTGLGGNHIYSILKQHNGFLGISRSKVWNVIFELLIPVELYSETENFELYGKTDII